MAFSRIGRGQRCRPFSEVIDLESFSIDPPSGTVILIS
jgi:hypothetical protein